MKNYAWASNISRIKKTDNTELLHFILTTVGNCAALLLLLVVYTNTWTGLLQLTQERSEFGTSPTGDVTATHTS